MTTSDHSKFAVKSFLNFVLLQSHQRKRKRACKPLWIQTTKKFQRRKQLHVTNPPRSTATAGRREGILPIVPTGCREGNLPIASGTAGRREGILPIVPAGRREGNLPIAGGKNMEFNNQRIGKIPKILNMLIGKTPKVQTIIGEAQQIPKLVESRRLRTKKRT